MIKRMREGGGGDGANEEAVGEGMREFVDLCRIRFDAGSRVSEGLKV